MSILFLSFIVPIFAWNIPLVSLIYLKRSLVFPILFFLLFLCFDHWGRLSYLSLLFFEIWVYLCIQMGNPLTNRLKGLDLIDKCLKNYGWRFLTLYRRQWSRPSASKRNAERKMVVWGRLSKRWEKIQLYCCINYSEKIKHLNPQWLLNLFIFSFNSSNE